LASALAWGVKSGVLAGFSYDLQSLIQSITTMVLFISAFAALGRVWLQKAHIV
jgi:hypothetical protein